MEQIKTKEQFIEKYWKDSVYSDGSALFVSTQQPAIGEKVRIRIRMLEWAPVQKVVLRYIMDGSQRTAQMHWIRAERGLSYYETEVTMTQKKLRYQFYLQGVKENSLYCYTQKGLTSYLQNETYDFCLLADYEQPSWVKHAVFYQIFPERFANGDSSLDVQDGEILQEGFASQHIRNWYQAPAHYEESHCLDFYGGDLIGIQQKIPYLKELGVTAIYLNPIFQAPSIHKYDCIDYEHVDPHFGGDEALANLSKALHENGMRLILDISINHTGTEHKWFNRDCTFFDKSIGAYHNPQNKEREYYFLDNDGSYMGWLGHLNMPELNYHSASLRDKLYRAEDAVLRKWLKAPYHIDGWRFDVADVMAKYGPDQLDHEVWKEIRSAIKEENPQAYILAEEWNDCSEYLQGEEWDSPMDYYACARIWRPFIGMSDPVLDMTGELWGIRQRISAEAVREKMQSFLGLLPFALQQNLFNLIDSHDVNRLHNNEGIHPEEYRGAVIGQFTMMGSPCIYYGDEAAIDGYVDTIEGCRYPMPWNTGFEHKDTYQLYQKLSHLRTAHKAFAEGTFQFLYAAGQILSFARQDEKECWITVISTEREDYWLPLPVGILGAQDLEESNSFEQFSAVDALGKEMLFRKDDCGVIKLLVKAHEAYLFESRTSIPELF